MKEFIDPTRRNRPRTAPHARARSSQSWRGSAGFRLEALRILLGDCHVHPVRSHLAPGPPPESARRLAVAAPPFDHAGHRISSRSGRADRARFSVEEPRSIGFARPEGRIEPRRLRCARAGIAATCRLRSPSTTRTLDDQHDRVTSPRDRDRWSRANKRPHIVGILPLCLPVCSRPLFCFGRGTRPGAWAPYIIIKYAESARDSITAAVAASNAGDVRRIGAGSGGRGAGETGGAAPGHAGRKRTTRCLTRRPCRAAPRGKDRSGGSARGAAVKGPRPETALAQGRASLRRGSASAFGDPSVNDEPPPNSGEGLGYLIFSAGERDGA